MATTPSTTPLALGDIGIFHAATFHRKCDLSELEVDFTLDDSSPGKDFLFTSNEEIRIEYQGTGITIDFGEAAGFVFKASQLRHMAIARLPALEEKLIELFLEGMWKWDCCIVTELRMMEAASLFCSGGGSAHLELRATTAFAGPLPDLADAGLSVTAQRNMNTILIAQAPLTQFYCTRRIKASTLQTDDEKQKPTFETYIPG